MIDTIETLSYRVSELEDKMDKNREDHGQFFARIESMENGHGIVLNDISNIKDLCNEIKADVKDLKERPAKRWDGIANAVLQWVVLAILAAYTALG